MDEQSKIKHSKRLQQKQNYVRKETRIAKQYGIEVKEPHRFAKHSPLNCGNPKCHMCANPRKTFKELTIQEQKQFQDLDSVRDRHSNGFQVTDLDDPKRLEFERKRNYNLNNEHIEWDNWKPID